MNAVILAGGEGSRLRPMTCDIPKPMAPICSKPVIFHILELLHKHGVRNVTVTLGYLPEVLTDLLQDRPTDGMTVNFLKEETPLGTAGGVKLAAQNFTDDFLVISGDALCNFDLTAALEYHKRKNAVATIITTPVDDPREYGLVTSGEDGLVSGFVEKPSWKQVTSNRANTGVYLLSPKVLSYIESKLKQDFAFDVFPKLLADKQAVYAWNSQDYWCDIGDLNSYLACHMDYLNGATKLSMPPQQRVGVYCDEKLPQGDYKLFPPVYLGKGVSIASGAVIGPNAVISDGCYIGEQSRVRNSVVLQNVFLGDRVSLTGAIVCADVSIRNQAALFEGCVIGSSALIGEDAQIMPGVCIWPRKTVEGGAIVDHNLKHGEGHRELFDDSGISGVPGVDVTPELCTLIGAAVGSVVRDGRVGVAYRGNVAQQAMTAALMVGIQSAGSAVWNFGTMSYAQTAFAATHCGLPLTVFVSGEDSCCIRLLQNGGKAVDRKLERNIAARIQKRDFNRCSPGQYLPSVDMRGVTHQYRRYLASLAPQGLSRVAAWVGCDDHEIQKFLNELLRSLGCKQDRSFKLQIADDGTSLTVSTSQGELVSAHRIEILIASLLLRRGYDVSLPFAESDYLRDIAREHKRMILHDEAESESVKALIFSDAVMQAVFLLSVLQSGIAFSDLIREIPDRAVLTRKIRLDSQLPDLLEYLSRQGEPSVSGIRFHSDHATAMVNPSKNGRMLQLQAEAANMEAAREICGEIEKKINAFALDRSAKK